MFREKENTPPLVVGFFSPFTTLIPFTLPTCHYYVHYTHSSDTVRIQFYVYFRATLKMSYTPSFHVVYWAFFSACNSVSQTLVKFMEARAWIVFILHKVTDKIGAAGKLGKHMHRCIVYHCRCLHLKYSF